MSDPFYHETKFVVVLAYPESYGGMEEGWNRAWIHSKKSEHDTHDEAVAAWEALCEALEAVHDEFAVARIVCPEWWSKVEAKIQAQMIAEDDTNIPF